MSTSGTRGLLARARTVISGPRDLWLVTRMCVWCCGLRVLKHVVPLPMLVELVRRKPRGCRPGNDARKIVILARWACRATRWCSLGSPTNASCLERALLTYRYLTGLDANPTLVIGVRPGLVRGDPLSGHAWVTLDGAALDDTDEALDGFFSVIAFAADGRRIAD